MKAENFELLHNELCRSIIEGLPFGVPEDETEASFFRKAFEKLFRFEEVDASVFAEAIRATLCAEVALRHGPGGRFCCDRQGKHDKYFSCQQGIAESRIEQSRKVLLEKAKEYASNSDRLHNFKAAATLAGSVPEKALLGMLLKHVVSVLDMLEGRLAPTNYLINEKIGDTLNYLVLLAAVIEDEFGQDYKEEKPVKKADMFDHYYPEEK